MSLLDELMPYPAEAVIELNDVFGPVDGPRMLDDVDSAIEASVGNSGRFVSQQFVIDAWPDVCLHLASHIYEIRQQQIERLKSDLTTLGYEPDVDLTPELINEISKTDSKMAVRARSVSQNVVEIVMNHANRSEKDRGKNGSTFYVAVTNNNLIYYSQKRYLLDLLRDHRIVELHEVLNQDNGGLWPNNHQFRSSKVANARSIPASRRLLKDLNVEEQLSPLEIAYVDKFGNILLRARDPKAYTELLSRGGQAFLSVGDKQAKVDIGTNLDSSRPNQPTIYCDPKAEGSKYIELIIKSEDCLSGRGHALEFVRKIAAREVPLKDLRDLKLDLREA